MTAQWRPQLPRPADLSDAEAALYDRARAIARSDMAPLAESEPPGILNRTLVAALAGAGLVPAAVP